MHWSRQVLDAVFAKANGSCRYCGRELERELIVDEGEQAFGQSVWWVDHWRSPASCASREEYESVDNLVPACRRCVRDKGALSGVEYAEQLRRPHRERWSASIREAVFDKTDGYCAYCATPLAWDDGERCGELRPPESAWDVDRWDPPGRCEDGRGVDSFANLVPACCGCIREKGAQTGDEYVALLRRRAGLD